MLTTSHDAFVLSTTPKKIQEKDSHRVVHNLQNQEAVANIRIRYGGDGTYRSYFEMVAGTTRIQDVSAPPEELWAFSNVDGAILTVETRTLGEFEA